MPTKATKSVFELMPFELAFSRISYAIATIISILPQPPSSLERGVNAQAATSQLARDRASSRVDSKEVKKVKEDHFSDFSVSACNPHLPEGTDVVLDIYLVGLLFQARNSRDTLTSAEVHQARTLSHCGERRHHRVNSISNHRNHSALP